MIEIIISAGIIAMLTGIFLANYRSASERSVLNIFIHEMAGDIRLMQNYALGSYNYKGAIPAGGWGFYIDTSLNRYVLFADVDGDKQYGGSGEFFQSVNFPEHIVVDDIYTDSSLSSVNVTFVPPLPAVNIGDVLNSYNDLIVSLKDDRSGMMRSINLNYFGLVDVQRN